MGCSSCKCCSTAKSQRARVDKHEDDRQLDQWHVLETGVASVDEFFPNLYAPVITMIDLNNNMADAMEAVKLMVAEMIGAFQLNIQIKNVDGKFQISAAIMDNNKVVLDVAASKALFDKEPQLLKEFEGLQETISDTNQELAKLAKQEKKPAAVVLVKAFKVEAQTEEQKRFKHKDLNDAIANMNAKAFHVVQELVKASAKDSLNLGKAFQKAFERLKKEMQDAAENFEAPTLNMDAIAAGDLMNAINFGGFDPLSTIPVFGSIFELFKIVGDSVKQIAELKPQVEAVPETVQNFDAQAAVTEAAGNPFEVPGIMAKVALNAKYGPEAPKVLAHVSRTCLVVGNELKAAFESTFVGK